MSEIRSQATPARDARTCSIGSCTVRAIARGLCNPHYKAAKRAGELPPKLDPIVRTQRTFWSRVVKTEHCWEWRGYVSRYGYGQFAFSPGKTHRAHKLAWEWQNGPVPNGLVLDHLCRNRACVRPEHLEPVTPRTNALRGIGVTAVNSRKRFCKQGHEFTTENTRIGTSGGRICRTCSNALSVERSTAKKNARAAKPCGAPTNSGAPCNRPVAKGKLCRYHIPATVLFTPGEAG